MRLVGFIMKKKVTNVIHHILFSFKTWRKKRDGTVLPKQVGVTEDYATVDVVRAFIWLIKGSMSQPVSPYSH